MCEFVTIKNSMENIAEIKPLSEDVRKIFVPQYLKDIFRNGLVFDSNATMTSRKMNNEDFPKLPILKTLNKTKLNDLNFIKTKSDDEVWHFCYMRCLLVRNKNELLSEIENKVFIATLFVAFTSGMIKLDANAKFMDNLAEFDNEVTNFDVHKMDEELAKYTYDIFNYLDIGVNIISFSVLNFIKLNHHFPSIGISANSKMFLPIPKENIKNLISENKVFTELFFKTIYPACKLIHEVCWYYKVILAEFNYLCNIDMELLKVKHHLVYRAEDNLIKVRSKPTVNMFTTISIMKLMINKYEEYNIAFLVFNPMLVNMVFELDEEIRNNPFRYHPSRNYFKIAAEDYSDMCLRRDSLNSSFGGILYEFVINYTGSLKEARSAYKYANTATLKDIAVNKFFYEMLGQQINLTEDLKKLILNKNNINILEIKDENQLNSAIKSYTDARSLKL